MEAFLATLESGIVAGSIYSLIAVGMNLLLVVTDVIQFAYGEVVVISMFVCWLILQAGGGPVLAFLAAAVTCLAIQVIIEPLLRGLRERRLVTETLIMTIAIGMVLTEIMSHHFNAGLPIAFPDSVVGGGGALTFGLIRITAADAYVILATIASLTTLAYFLFKTKQGKALRAMAYNIHIARLLGIPLRRGTILSFLIAGLLSGITAILSILTLGAASPELGAHITFKGLAVMLLGGMGNLKGGVVGGFVLGIIESMVRGYFIGDWADAIAMGSIMFVIILKPDGILGKAK